MIDAIIWVKPGGESNGTLPVRAPSGTTASVGNVTRSSRHRKLEADMRIGSTKIALSRCGLERTPRPLIAPSCQIVICIIVLSIHTPVGNASPRPVYAAGSTELRGFISCASEKIEVEMSETLAATGNI